MKDKDDIKKMLMDDTKYFEERMKKLQELFDKYEK